MGLSECLACNPHHEGKPCRFRLAREALIAACKALPGEAGGRGHQHVQARGRSPRWHDELWVEIFEGDACEDGSGAVVSVWQVVGADDDLATVSALLAAEWAQKIGGAA